MMIGVLGGMGPAATTDFLGRLVAMTPAARDQDHLHMLVDCNPQVPDRNAAIAGTGESPGPALAAMARRLESAGAAMLAMPCNTAHAFADDIRAAVAIPLVDMVEETVAVLADASAGPVGILAGDGCLAAGLYQDALERVGIRAVVPAPDDQRAFMGLLYAIKAGEQGPTARAAMARIAGALIDAGAARIVAGCTEVPIVLDQADIAVPLIVSTHILAATLLQRARVVA